MKKITEEGKDNIAAIVVFVILMVIIILTACLIGNYCVKNSIGIEDNSSNMERTPEDNALATDTTPEAAVCYVNFTSNDDITDVIGFDCDVNSISDKQYIKS